MHFHVATNIIKIWEVAIDAHKAYNCQIEFLMHQYQTVQTMRFKKKVFSAHFWHSFPECHHLSV